jgi:3-dehydroquinate dehydratase/shikimate dehydrogenase
VSGNVPTIETPRLLLRDWRNADVEPWVEMNRDPRVTEFFPRSYTREHSQSMASAIRRDLDLLGYGWWVVQVRDGPSFAGVICLQEVPFQAHFTPAHEIGWRFTFETWGNGYATEGAKAALDFGFRELHWDRIVAITSKMNLRSQRVMERLGMRRNPSDDFDHPRIEEGHRLRRHVLYRISSNVPRLVRIDR